MESALMECNEILSIRVMKSYSLLVSKAEHAAKKAAKLAGKTGGPAAAKAAKKAAEEAAKHAAASGRGSHIILWRNYDWEIETVRNHMAIW